MLKINNLRKTYGDLVAVDEVSFTLERSSSRRAGRWTASTR
jgi:ABC-type branched-subunit amino acid transport system ATPase component